VLVVGGVLGALEWLEAGLGRKALVAENMLLSVCSDFAQRVEGKELRTVLLCVRRIALC
jgi:hypothetical protein